MILILFNFLYKFNINIQMFLYNCILIHIIHIIKFPFNLIIHFFIIQFLISKFQRDRDNENFSLPKFSLSSFNSFKKFFYQLFIYRVSTFHRLLNLLRSFIYNFYSFTSLSCHARYLLLL